jgi:hypothetical protein
MPRLRPPPPLQCSRTSLAFFVRLSVVGLLRWLVGWLVGTALLRSLVCRWYSSFLPSFVGRKPFFPLVVGRRSSFVSSSLMDLRSFVRPLVVGIRSFVRSFVHSFVRSFVRSSFVGLVRCGGACFVSEGILLRLDDGSRRRCFCCCCCCDAELSCAW